MAKEKSIAAPAGTSSWFSELFHTGLYKRSQGKIARQATFAALGVTLPLFAWRLSVYLTTAQVTGTTEWLMGIWPLSTMSIAAHNKVIGFVELISLEYSVPLIVMAIGLWVSYRIVNIPRFADFLIAVEAEMNKVSWPSKDELIRSSIVVIFVIVMMSALLYGYDALWTLIFSDRVLGILHTG